MMGFGFWELALVGVVGLLVLGPERLPATARTLGAYLRRARQTWAGLRHEIERELAADELRRALDGRDSVQSRSPAEDTRRSSTVESAAPGQEPPASPEPRNDSPSGS